MAALPLMHQPGEVWEYSLSTDVLGRIVEIIEGASLGEVLQQRLFGPLHMVDTAFFTPESKARPARRPVLVRLHDSGRGRHARFDLAAQIRVRRRRTPVDARRLCPLRRHAELRRRRSTAYAFSAPARSPSWRATTSTPGVRKGHYLLWPGHGFGLGFAVRTDPGKAPTAGSVGEFFWGGMMGTAFWVSPRDSLFAVLMVQTPENREYFRELFRNLVSAAIA